MELGAGFHPDLTGAENLVLNASLLGLSRKKTYEEFDSIVEFSGIGEFIEEPLRTYSSGMILRLAFAVAVRVNPDVLVHRRGALGRRSAIPEQMRRGDQAPQACGQDPDLRLARYQGRSRTMRVGVVAGARQDQNVRACRQLSSMATKNGRPPAQETSAQV